MDETQKLIISLKKKLEKIDATKKEIEDLLKAIEGKPVKEKPISASYGTSCVQLRNKKGKMLMEF